jgi:hypothetical protein
MINGKGNSNMNTREIYVVQDGDLVNPHTYLLFSNGFDPKDFIVNQDGERYNFVGFIFHNEKVLISFPKHSFRPTDLESLSHNRVWLNKSIRTLFNCIKRTVNNKNDKYVGIRNELNSDYPFLDFLEVYQYYKRYGLFTNEKEIKKFGYAGRISWKDTMNKSPKMINNHNLLFLPLIIKENIEQHVFISKCMAYVIDSTLEKFSLFLEGEKTNLHTSDIDFSNTSLVITQLKKVKRTLFKNIHQRLVDTLISFFEQKRNKGGNYQLKIYSFHLVWESMVKEFLRTKFSGINDRLEVEWADSLRDNHFVKKVAYPDHRGAEGFSVEPDYYLVSDDKRYIFDAKYYQTLSKLDYKQVAYYFLLKHFETRRDASGNIIHELETFNALILPTEKEPYNEVHFSLNREYNLNEKQFVIMAYYLNMINVMEHYTNSY